MSTIRSRQIIPDMTAARGMALVLMLVIMVLGVAAMLTGSLGISAAANARRQQTAAALAQAKDALLGYAISYGDTHGGEVHGYLPCPDLAGGNAEGSAELSCGSKNVSQLGRLPWKTLDLPVLRDGDGECLWYAVAGTYKNNPKTDLMNWDNNGLFEIVDASGAIIAQNVVAVVFAPGAAFDGQDRAPDGAAPLCGGNYGVANYLDRDGTIDHAAVTGTANAISRFRAAASAQVNDRVIYLTRDEIFNVLKRRSDFYAKLRAMTRGVAECIAGFGRENNTVANLSLPWPAPLMLADYGKNTAYNDKTGLYAGRVPYQVDSSRVQAGNAASSDYLLSGSGANCPAAAGWPALYPWWNNWKDHLYYAIGRNFQPDNAPTPPCGACLGINGSGEYAAVVLFAGEPLAALGQTHADKSSVADYLEGRNAANVNSASGGEDYQTAAASSTFNDILYCIRTDLSVVPCP